MNFSDTDALDNAPVQMVVRNIATYSTQLLFAIPLFKGDVIRVSPAVAAQLGEKGKLTLADNQEVRFFVAATDADGPVKYDFTAPDIAKLVAEKATSDAIQRAARRAAEALNAENAPQAEDAPQDDETKSASVAASLPPSPRKGTGRVTQRAAAR